MARFPKSERICIQKDIDALWQAKAPLFSPPLRAQFRWEPIREGIPSQRVLIVVAKRFFKRAHDRNRLKRQLREIFRLSKHKYAEWLSSQELRVDILIMYNSPKPEPYLQLNLAFHALWEKAIKKKGLKIPGDTNQAEGKGLAP